MDDRDSEDSAPAEFPPEQPEADTVEDDGTTYGAEEEEEEELEELKAAEGAKIDGEDEEMGGADDTAGPSNPEVAKAEGEDDESDAGSEDLEAESSGSEEEEIDEEEGEGEGEGDEDMEMAEDGDQAGERSARKAHPPDQTTQGEVMVH